MSRDSSTVNSEEGPANTEEETLTPVIVDDKAAMMTVKKKTKKVMKRVSPEHVEFVLTAKPTRRSRLPQHMQMSEELRRQSAWVDEVVRSNNELLRSMQDKYRHDLATNGYVEVDVDVTDDEAA